MINYKLIKVIFYVTTILLHIITLGLLLDLIFKGFHLLNPIVCDEIDFSFIWIFIAISFTFGLMSISSLIYEWVMRE